MDNMHAYLTGNAPTRAAIRLEFERLHKEWVFDPKTHTYTFKATGLHPFSVSSALHAESLTALELDRNNIGVNDPQL